MAALRSLLLAIAMVILTIPYSLLALACRGFAPLTRYRIITSWSRAVVFCARWICGVRWRVIGRENIPQAPSVVLSKHQSAWETMAFQLIFPPQAYVLKRELLRVPFFGWGLAMLPNIAIDRASGREALEQVTAIGKVRLAAGFWVVIYPEGTRVPVGEKKRFKQGGAVLARAAGTAVVPVAHNAGEFWPRNAFVKHPGEIIVSVGPPIATAGLSAQEINARAERWIDAEMHRLFPHHFKSAGPERAVSA
ncbi:MAG: 1-acyl-sn-glycerol-3-phosphate acyltransferase [Rhodocyclaceae bacterium]|nr:1-acyl-sn-glycerol-3-phosphate acyltransferase [Rhodocyclaceae bacterium]MBX3669023.1 1-acyl-sn-glycerol-3-phosphate acyltransferase [Rhodocyclaceae bacterium]